MLPAAVDLLDRCSATSGIPLAAVQAKKKSHRPGPPVVWYSARINDPLQGNDVCVRDDAAATVQIGGVAFGSYKDMGNGACPCADKVWSVHSSCIMHAHELRATNMCLQQCKCTFPQLKNYRLHNCEVGEVCHPTS